MKPKPRPSATLLTIGAELLKGSTTNTNARFLGQRLLGAGFYVRQQIACDDNVREIHRCLKLALKESDLVILSGGLGPTPDDVTRSAIATFFKSELIVCPAQLTRIKKVYRSLGRIMPPEVLCEALHPKSSAPLINRYGIALGFWINHRSKHIVVLPGVPRELENLMDYSVLPRLKKHYPQPAVMHPLIIKTVGLSEPAIMDKLGRDFFDDMFEFGIYPHPGEVTLRIYAPSRIVHKRIKTKAMTRLKEWIYSTREESLAQAIGRCLTRSKHKVSVAESCTGGLLASEFTRHAGASHFFQGGLVAYDNRVKRKLGVSAKVLKNQGAVSKLTATQLAAQSARFFQTQWSIGVTGIAGPEGGSSKKPVGTVFIALQGPHHRQKTEHFLFWGSREQVQQRTVAKALELLWRALTSYKAQR